MKMNTPTTVLKAIYNCLILSLICFAVVNCSSPQNDSSSQNTPSPQHFTIKKTYLCPHCNGTGRLICPVCNGDKIIHPICNDCNGTGSRKIKCPECWGTGKDIFPPRTEICNKCNGTGTIQETCAFCKDSGVDSHTVTCSRCAGKGYIDCVICDGTGETK